MISDIGADFRKAFAEFDATKTEQELVVFGAGAMAGCLVKSFVDKGKSLFFKFKCVILGCFTRNEMVLVTKSKESAKKWQAEGFQRAYSMDVYLKEGKYC
jgi:hypothetical protein